MSAQAPSPHDDDEDHKATLKYGAPVVRPPRPPLVRLLPYSIALGIALATVFLLSFGDRLSSHAVAERSGGAREPAVVTTTAEAPRRVGSGETAGASSDAEPSLDPCASPKAADWPERLCTWVVARARGEDLVPGPTTRDVQAFLFQKGLARVRGRVTGEPDASGLRQAVVQGVWGHCVKLVSEPGPDGAFSTWVQKRSERATIVVGGREQACVALDENPIGAVGDLLFTKPGPESAEIAKRVLGAL